MRNLKLKGIVVVTALTIMLTGCTTTNQTINKENNNSSVTQETIYEDTTKKEDVIIETSPEKVETTPEIPIAQESTQTKENFTFFEDAKQEIIAYIESEEFELLKEKGKYYVTTGIDFIFFDEPINGIYFDDLTEQLKQDILRDVKALDETIMAYYPNYKESISSKYEIASEFLSDKYYAVLDYIKDYLGEENYNAIGEIKDQVLGDVGDKADEVIDDIKELYKGWKNK